MQARNVRYRICLCILAQGEKVMCLSFWLQFILSRLDILHSWCPSIEHAINFNDIFTDREPLNDPCIERLVFSSMQRGNYDSFIFARQWNKKNMRKAEEQRVTKTVKKTVPRLLVRLNRFPPFFYFSPFIFRKASISWRSRAIKFLVVTSLPILIHAAATLSRSHIIFNGALMIIRYHFFLPPRKSTAT